MADIEKIWKQILLSFWFVPSLMTVFIIGLAVLTLILDETYFREISRYAPWLFTGTPDAARSILSTIATAIAAVTSVVFSIVIVALQLSASQYSPRTLRTFIQDRGNQISLGIYIATIVYSLLILRGVRRETETVESFVPQISVTIAIIMTLISLGVLIYFINQVIKSLQITNILNQIHSDLIHQIENLFPEKLGVPVKEPAKPEEIIKKQKKQEKTQVVKAKSAGLVQNVNQDGLKRLKEYDLKWFYVLPKIGQFVGFDEEIIHYSGKTKPEELEPKVKDIVVIQNQRTSDQDPLFPIQQLSDVTIKTHQSDPTTAEYCVNYLTNGLSCLAGRKFPENFRKFKNNDTLFIFNKPDWEEFVEKSFSKLAPDMLTNFHSARIFVDALVRLAKSVDRNSRRQPVLNELKRARELLTGRQLGTKKDLEGLLRKIDRALD